MPQSMTGFGRALLRVKQATLVGEVRSVNARFLKVTMKLPEGFDSYVPEIERLISSRLHRGSVFYRLELQPRARGPRYELDVKVLTDYYAQLGRLYKALGISGAPALSELLSLPGSLRNGALTLLHDQGFLASVTKVTETALERLLRMRGREGRNLSRQLHSSLKKIKRLVDKIRCGNPRVLKMYIARLQKRAGQLARQAGLNLGKAELVKELVLSAERADLTEELDRLTSHLQQCGSFLRSEGPVGRKLEFLVQEMLREANTMSSKCVDSTLVQDVLELKAHVDRLREQVLNLE